MSDTVTVAIGEFGLRALGGGSAEDPAGATRSLAQAIRYYLADRGCGRTEWLFPELIRGRRLEAATEVPVVVDDAVWEEFSAEAERQGVSPDRLAQHAVLYLVADWDSGRLVERILAGLDA